jgi:hypothetical protein
MTITINSLEQIGDARITDLAKRAGYADRTAEFREALNQEIVFFRMFDGTADAGAIRKKIAPIAQASEHFLSALYDLDEEAASCLTARLEPDNANVSARQVVVALSNFVERIGRATESLIENSVNEMPLRVRSKGRRFANLEDLAAGLATIYEGGLGRGSFDLGEEQDVETSGRRFDPARPAYRWLADILIALVPSLNPADRNQFDRLAKDARAAVNNPPPAAPFYR